MGDLPWCCGWGGGRGSAVHVGGWREGEGVAHPWEPRGGPRAGDVGESWSERLVSGWRKGSPGNRRPAPGGLLPRPSARAVRGRLQLCLRGCGGNWQRAAPDPPAEEPLEKRERGGSVRQPRGQAAAPSVVRRPSPGALGWAGVRDLLRGCCCSFEDATTSGRVTFLLAFAGKEIHVQRISVLIATPTLLKVFLQWECLSSYPGPFDGSHSGCQI